MKEFFRSLASAPSSTANFGPGFDTFSLALDLFEDKIEITKYETKRKKISIKIEDTKYTVPKKINENSASLVVMKMMEDHGINNDIEIKITKNVPPGYGIGSSAASSAAAALAFDRLFNLNLDKRKLIKYAAEGEIASAGIKHYDNVTGSLIGGFTIVRTIPEVEYIRFEPPKNLFFVIGIPIIPTPKKKTEKSRSVLPKKILLKHAINNIINASCIVAGFASKDIEMIAKGIDDQIVEPARKHLIPGYDDIKKNAIKNGALALTISGAGPSVIAILNTKENAQEVIKSIKNGFMKVGVKSNVYLCKPSNGAKILKVE